MLLNEVFGETHGKLNPKIWNGFDLKPEILEHLKLIADKFIEYLEIPEGSVSDVIFTGSNANFNYTKFSDIDLHIVVDEEKLGSSCKDFIEKYFKAAKTEWNDEHDITIHGYDVELYAQPKDDDLAATGIYSVLNKKWIARPSPITAHSINSKAVSAKADEIKSKIDSIISGNLGPDTAHDIKDKIKKLRKAGLENGGEFSTENLVFKELRNSGYLDKLSKYYLKSYDKKLSL